MTTMLAHRYRRGELHEFRAADNEFIYLVSAGAIFALDDLPEKWNEFTAKNAAYYGK